MSPLLKARRPPQRRFVEQPSSQENWQVLHRIADKNVASIRRILARAFQRFRQALRIDDIRMLYRMGALDQIDQHIDLVFAQHIQEQLEEQLRPRFHAMVAESGAAMIPFTEAAIRRGFPVGEINLRFDVVNPEAVRLIQQYTAEKVTEIGRETRQGIKNLVRRSFTQGRTVDVLARDLERVVGLRSNQVFRLMGLRQQMEAQELSPSLINRRMDRLARKALRQRTMMIARTETIDASARGQQELWDQAAQQGYLNLATARKHWVVTPDDITCEQICLPIPVRNPNGVSLNEPFDTPRGPKMGPTAHPH